MSGKNLPKKQLPPGSKPSPPDKVYEAGRPEDRSDGSDVRVEAFSQEFRGPLPPPGLLKQYDDIVPGAARDIIQSFVKEGEHRRSLQTRDTAMCEEWARADVGLQRRGQQFGFVIAIVSVVGSLYAAIHGAQAAGAIVGGTTLVGIVAAFLRQRNMAPIDSGDKSEKPAAKSEEKE
jgi:uncharacterized membrane protein